tara:strand:- start:499 stop:1416 length:918 start_codon:yes stop_codon:yes gene_type:complete
MGWFDYKTAKRCLKTARSQDKGKPLYRNTRLWWRGSDVAVQYHNTDIILLKRKGQVVLNDGGWRTATTKSRLNEFSDPFIWSEKGTWYFSLGKEDYIWNTPITIKDGEVIKSDSSGYGMFSQKKNDGGLLRNTVEPWRNHSVAQQKAIRGYALAYKNRALSGVLKAQCPNCFRGDMTSQQWKDHLRGHLKDKVYPRELGIRIIREWMHPGSLSYSPQYRQKCPGLQPSKFRLSFPALKASSKEKRCIDRDVAKILEELQPPLMPVDGQQSWLPTSSTRTVELLEGMMIFFMYLSLKENKNGDDTD